MVVVLEVGVTLQNPYFMCFRRVEVRRTSQVTRSTWHRFSDFTSMHEMLALCLGVLHERRLALITHANLSVTTQNDPLLA